MHFILKRLYASIEIHNGEILQSYKNIPKGFIIDLRDVISTVTNGYIYIKQKRGVKTLSFSGNFTSSQRQRIVNLWGIHKVKYK